METLGKTSESLAIGPVSVLPSQGRVAGPGGTGRLEPRVMDLLVYLASHGGAVMGRDAIIRDVWRGTLVTDAVISRSIHQIRRALAKIGGSSSWLETIPKRGYRLVVPPADAVTEPQPVRRARLPWIVGVLGVAGALGLLGILGMRHDPHAPPGAEAYRLYLQGRAYAQQNRAGAYQQAAEYFRQASVEDPHFAAAFAATAVSEMLQVDMGNRTVAEATRAAAGPAREALRLDPQLPEAQAANGLIALYQGDFATAGAELRSATALRPNYAQAQMWLGRLALAEWQVNRAVASFDRARELDPDSPIVLLNCGLALDLAGREPAAAEVLQRAIAIDPKFANLYWALGHVRWSQGNFDEAETLYARAIDMGANYSTLYAQYAVLLTDLGRTVESAPWIERAARVDPRDAWLWIAALTTASPPQDAQPARAPADARDALLAAELAAQAGDFGHARQLLDGIDLHAAGTLKLLHSGWLTEAGHLPMLDVAAIYLHGGDAARGRSMLAEARAYLADLKDRGLDTAGMDYNEAAAAALDGDRTHALESLRSAMARHWPEAVGALHDPKFASLRGDKQFVAMLSP